MSSCNGQSGLAVWALLIVTLAPQISIVATEDIGYASISTPYLCPAAHLFEVAKTHEQPYPFSEAYESYGRHPPAHCKDAIGEKYRRADGVCNNLRNPFQGATLDTQRRLFSNSFLDGRAFPRVLSKRTREILPSARLVSNLCFVNEDDANGNGANQLASQLAWQVGQYLAHDVTLIDKVEGQETCCDDFNPKKPLQHLIDPDERQCFPIPIPANDTHFSTNCMTFSRSFSVELFGERHPINGVTSYIDLSVVYGSSEYFQKQIRTGVQGQLKTSCEKDLVRLPGFGNFPCIKPAGVSHCPASGDVRVSDQPGLGAMHTMFHLEHNRVAQRLAQLNPFWDDERIFQEAKKFMSAVFQKIIYEEYLPLILGNDVMKTFGLDGEYIYDETVDGGAILDFTSAAFRFGHTLLNTNVHGAKLSTQFLQPVTVKTLNYHTIPFSQADNKAHNFNNGFTSEVRNRLFENINVPGFSATPGSSFDLPALNIQRGRDHGIVPYIVARDTCVKLLKDVQGVTVGLPACHNTVYKHKDDIDLFVGGVSEQPLPGAVLGPTFACLVAIQSKRLRDGDRFFYETKGIEGFTAAQLKLIRRNSLATLICQQNPDGMLQEKPLRPVSADNPKVTCRSILRKRKFLTGIAAWKDNSSNFLGTIRQAFVQPISEVDLDEAPGVVTAS